MTKKQTRNCVIVRFVALIGAFPMIFGIFFSGFTIKSSGAQVNTPVKVNLLDYVSRDETILTIAFLTIVLMLVCIVFLAIHSILNVLGKTKSQFLSITVNIIQLVFCVLAFVLVAVYCVTSTTKTATSSLVYTIGGSSIVYFICGLVFGGAMLLSLIMQYKYEKKNKKKSRRKKIDNKENNETNCLPNN